MKLARVYRTPLPNAYAEGYLRGGTGATTVAGTFAAVSDGEFTISIDGTAYDITAIDFTGLGTMALVAAAIQTAIRAAAGGAEIVEFLTDHFVIISGITGSTSAVSKATAVSGGSGTDISGAGATPFMDCDAGATGEIVVAAEAGYQTLTTSARTLGKQFSIAHAGQLSLKPVHKAYAAGETPTVYIEVSDDPIGTAEASSLWHPIGVQESPGGAVAEIQESEYQYDLNISTTTTDETATPLRYTAVSQKARVRAFSDFPQGRIKVSVGLVEH